MEKQSVQSLKMTIIKVLKRYGIQKASLFGSYACGSQRRRSDIDILIQPPKGMGLEFVGVKLELEEKLKRKVDLVTYKSLHPYLKKSILSSEIRIL